MSPNLFETRTPVGKTKGIMRCQRDWGCTLGGLGAREPAASSSSDAQCSLPASWEVQRSRGRSLISGGLSEERCHGGTAARQWAGTGSSGHTEGLKTALLTTGNNAVATCVWYPPPCI